ncbi:MAG: ABC transporter ATP-binding protein [Gemmatimonadetes bacterium]|nr:ABC transporter ATP-binding protein [Gemmatimonadota bacterium]
MVSRAIDIRGLQVGYDDLLILQEIDAHVDRGEIAIVLGGSGCGKSTLLKTIIGLIQPRAGRVEVLGEDATALEDEDRDALSKRLGVMFQYGALLNSLTMAENLALPLEMHTDLKPDLVAAIVRTRLALVGLGHAYDRFPNELSGGMRKRAALARAMVLDPEILFCDEPGAGLDPITAAEIDELLLTLNRELGTTIVIVTHELLSIERLDGRLIMLDQGRVAFTGTVAEARRSDHPLVHPFFHPGGPPA